MKKIFVVTILLVSVLALSGFGFQEKSEFMKNPAKVVVWLLDFKLDLSDTQKKEVRGILEPVFAEIRSEHKKLISNPDELIAKIRNGKLEKLDITQKMEKRREFAAGYQEKAAETILKVYQVLTPEQRETLATIIKGHIDQIMN
ncbi:MAG: periplasmic heavy metal sensor [Candidatus Riflebacteria bacterium]|nr:periplasmic heavy metal sensor [Candidatus Riflebacteria bacterium]